MLDVLGCLEYPLFVRLLIRTCCQECQRPREKHDLENAHDVCPRPGFEERAPSISGEKSSVDHDEPFVEDLETAPFDAPFVFVSEPFADERLGVDDFDPR